MNRNHGRWGRAKVIIEVLMLGRRDGLDVIGVSMKPLLLAGCNTSLKNKWRLWIRKWDHYPEKIRKLDSWSCQPMIGVDWIYYSPFCWLRAHGGSWSNSPFWLVQSPCRWVNVTMFVAYCSHVCFSSQYFGSDPLSRGTLLAIFCRQTIQSCFLGTTCQSPQKKSSFGRDVDVSDGHRTKWEPIEGSLITSSNLTTIEDLGVNSPLIHHTGIGRIWPKMRGAKSTRVGIEPHQNGGYKLYCCCRIGYPLPKHCWDPHLCCCCHSCSPSATRASSILRDKPQ